MSNCRSFSLQTIFTLILMTHCFKMQINVLINSFCTKYYIFEILFRCCFFRTFFSIHLLNKCRYPYVLRYFNPCFCLPVHCACAKIKTITMNCSICKLYTSILTNAIILKFLTTNKMDFYLVTTIYILICIDKICFLFIIKFTMSNKLCGYK